MTRPRHDIEAAEPFAALYAEGGQRLPGPRRRRETALAALVAEGLPTQALEAWRKTPLLRALSGRRFTLPDAGPLGLDRAPRLLDGEAERLVLADGLLRPELSQAGGLAEALDPALLPEPASPDALARLNAAFGQQALRLDLPAGKRAETPVEITWLTGFSGAEPLSNPRLSVHLGAYAEATLVEQHLGLGDGGGLANHQAEIHLGEGARLRHVVLLSAGATGLHLAETRVRVARDARYETYLLFAGGGLVRRTLDIELAARGATALANGAYLLHGQEHGDLVTRIRHAAPDTASRETVKGALAGASRQVFQGLITVDPGAARADGRMSNKTLLLSDRATIDSKPELRIFHDEVQCAHGATSGKLDEAALFYLRSRGLPPPAARRLLIGSFLAETLEGLGDAALSEALGRRIETRLAEIAG